MKSMISHRIISAFLAIFIFISSSGMSVNIHYCGEEVYDYAFLGKLDSCKDIVESDSENLMVKEAGCCSFDHFKIDTSDSYKFSEFDKEAITHFDLSFTKIVSKTFIGNSILIHEDRIHLPPPNIKNNNIYLKIESFLI